MGSIDFEVLRSVWHGIEPFMPVLIALFAIWFVLSVPLIGRGPGLSRRDRWRSFRYGTRREVMERAGYRCEASMLLVWGRCRQRATDVDHIYPWSKGGPTILSNGQALCRSHNASKGALTPPWWLILGLERRRAGYVPPGTSVRVSARMTERERALRSGEGQYRSNREH